MKLRLFVQHDDFILNVLTANSWWFNKGSLKKGPEQLFVQGKCEVCGSQEEGEREMPVVIRGCREDPKIPSVCQSKNSDSCGFFSSWPPS